MIIDTHVHIGKDKGGARQSMEELRRNMGRYGINKAVIFPFDENGELVRRSLGLLRYRGSDIIPFLRFDPKHVTAEEVEELLAEYPFKGVKLHTRAQNFDPLDRRYYKIYRKIEESGKPLLIHSSKISRFGKRASINTDPDRAVKLARHFPDLDIIIAHLASVSWKAIDVIGREDNLFLDTSINGTTFVIRMLTDRIGPEKMVFGSDSPYSDQEIELLKIKKSGISREDMEKIFSRNLMKLLKV